MFGRRQVPDKSRRDKASTIISVVKQNVGRKTVIA